MPARLRDQDGALRALRLVVGQHLLQREVADDVTAQRRAHLSASSLTGSGTVFYHLGLCSTTHSSWRVFSSVASRPEHGGKH